MRQQRGERLLGLIIVMLSILLINITHGNEYAVKFEMVTKGDEESAVYYRCPYFDADWLNEEVGDLESWYDSNQESAEGMKADFDVDAFYHQEISVVLQTSRLIVMKFSTQSYSGGAHGASEITYKNLDLTTQQMIQWQDFFMDKEEAYDFMRLAEQLFRKEKGIGVEEKFSDHGYTFEAGFVLANEFAFLKEGILFHYNNYEIAPYSMGNIEFLISYETLDQFYQSRNGKLHQFIKKAVQIVSNSTDSINSIHPIDQEKVSE